VIAGLFDEIVQSGAFSPEDEDAVGSEVVVGVVGGSALVESEDPDVLLFHLLERADEVRNSRNSNVFGGSGRGFGYGGGYGGGSALGDNDAVDAGTVGGSKQGSEVVGVFDTVEGEEEAGLGWFLRCEEVFDCEEFSLTNDGQYALVGVGAGEPGELIPGLERNADAGGPAEVDEPLEAVVAAVVAFPGDGDMVQLAGTGTDGLLDRVETVKNFHDSSVLSKREIAARP
jgi:hypothetical protein